LKFSPPLGEAALMDRPRDEALRRAMAAARVVGTEIDGLGMLICGENTNPLARYTLMAQGAQVHISTYPAAYPTRPLEQDGKLVHDFILFQMKKKDEAKQPWDYYTILRRVPGDDAFAPLSESECPLLKRG